MHNAREDKRQNQRADQVVRKDPAEMDFVPMIDAAISAKSVSAPSPPSSRIRRNSSATARFSGVVRQEMAAFPYLKLGGRVRFQLHRVLEALSRHEIKAVGQK